MLGDFFTLTHHTPGTLAANQAIKFSLPFDCSLVFVSAVASNASNGILDVGSSSSAEAYVKDLDVGDSGTPALVDADTEFEGDVFPHIAAGTIIAVALDYDGAGGTAAQDFTLVLGFMKG
ncbi:MAG: hypothetical protein C3F13_18065 [Anaerolineales bacterium]|nr:MAG: hypothetical protein C3F13_18065 [Anaerolineales bacterium]